MAESKEQVPPEAIDLERRKFLSLSVAALGAVGAAFAAVPFVASWLPNEQAEAAGAPVEVDLSHLQPGEQMTVAWRGKPVWIIRRTEQMLSQLAKIEDKLRDPTSETDQQPIYAHNRFRSIKKDYLILVGICTHLGCSPKYVPTLGELGPNWAGGFFCPCHGSTFDLSGRVMKGVPAPINLEVPPHMYLSDHVVLIGADKSTQSA